MVHQSGVLRLKLDHQICHLDGRTIERMPRAKRLQRDLRAHLLEMPPEQLLLPLGELLAVGLDEILRRMPGLPEGLHFFVFEPRALVLHAALLTATAVVAALYPMWLAVTLPIARTLRQEVVS